MCNKRKAIMAIINGSLYIDPADASRENINELKEKAFKSIGKIIPVIVSPITQWMPKSGTAALIKEVMKGAKK